MADLGLDGMQIRFHAEAPTITLGTKSFSISALSNHATRNAARE
jgi:hypothetical protein